MDSRAIKLRMEDKVKKVILLDKMKVGCNLEKVLAPTGMTIAKLPTLSCLKNPVSSTYKGTSLVKLYKFQENCLTPPMGYCRCDLPKMLKLHVTETTRFGNQRKNLEIPFNWTHKYQFLVSCCAASAKITPMPRGVAGIVAACSLLIRRGISHSVLITNEETTTNDQRAGQVSETRIPQLMTAMSRPLSCKGRDLISEGMKTWQEDSINLENECLYLRSAVNLKDKQLKELQDEKAALTEKCRKHDEVLSQKDADVRRYEDENATLNGKLKKIEDLMKDKETEVTKLQEENAELKDRSTELENFMKQTDANVRSFNAQMAILVKGSNPISTSAVEKSSKSSTSERKGQKRAAREMMDDSPIKSQRSKKKARQAESSDECPVEPSEGEEESLASIPPGGHLESDVSQYLAD